jgi:hypothetical protein
VVLAITSLHSTRPGNYIVTVTATGGTETYFVIVGITVLHESRLV